MTKFDDWMLHYARSKQIRDATRDVVQEHFAEYERRLLAKTDGEETDDSPTQLSLASVVLQVRERTGFEFPAERKGDRR